jgi:tetratricopeptide (TPR) repeat protein
MRLAIVLAVLAVPAIVAARLVRWVEPAEEREARRAVREGRFDEAEASLARWRAAAPGSVEAVLLKGRVEAARNRPAEAAADLQLAMSLGGRLEDLVLLRALIAAKAGRHVEAEPALRRAFGEAREPDRQVDEALARVYLETYDLKRAADILDRWAADFPQDAKPHLWRAEIHGRDAAEADRLLDDYREALRRDPSLATARLGLAEALRKVHRNAEAAVAYEEYLAVRPDDATAHLGAGQNQAELGNEPAAARLLQRAIELDGKNATAHTELAQLCTRRGDTAAALEHLDRAIALEPYDVGVRYHRSLALARLGRTTEARAEQAFATRLRDDLDQLNKVRKRLVAAPGDRSSQLEVARWMFAHGHDQEGARWAEKILAERPLDPDASRMLADYHDRRGEKGLANGYRLNASGGSGSPGESGKFSGNP